MHSLLVAVVFSFITFGVPALGAQATGAIASGSDYLLRITQRWGATSPLGALPARPMDSVDVEVRLWGGYGFGGTAGTVLRRTRGRWEAWRARVVTCALDVPISVGDTLTAPSRAQYQAEAVRRCGEPYPRPNGFYGARVISADTVGLTPLAVQGTLPALWDDLLRVGLATLPPSVPRTWVMMDGHTYVVEFRRGAEYRTSVIERTSPPEAAADRVVQAVYATLQRYGAAPW